MKKKINILPKFDIDKLYKIQSYLGKSSIFFKELKDILDNIELSDNDKIICINNKLKEFESDVCI